MNNLVVVLLVISTSLIVLSGCALSSPTNLPKTEPTIEVILTGLENPRGIAVGPAGELFVTEAGTGFDAVDPTENTGKLTVFSDRNGDGDYDDPGEFERWFSHFPTYNANQFFRTHRDEVSGAAEVLLHRDGRLFLSVDGGLDDIALFEISPEGRVGRNLYPRSNLNGLAFDAQEEHIYGAASTANRLVEISLDGEIREVVAFPLLDSGQQAVPAGVSLDSETGDVLVALFSGAAVDDETGEVVPFFPGEAKIVRVNPQTGAFTDEITGLTTVVDLAADANGNIFVVELTSAAADPLPVLFDLFDPDAPPLHGGYLRFSGRVTLYPPGGELPRVLADGLDMPTNITLAQAPTGTGEVADVLYISTGQGTPSRPIPGPDGATTIVGEVVRISNYLNEARE